jgi:hypothetical protein
MGSLLESTCCAARARDKVSGFVPSALPSSLSDAEGNNQQASGLVWATFSSVSMVGTDRNVSTFTERFPGELATTYFWPPLD